MNSITRTAKQGIGDSMGTINQMVTGTATSNSEEPLLTFFQSIDLFNRSHLLSTTERLLCAGALTLGGQRALTSCTYV